MAYLEDYASCESSYEKALANYKAFIKTTTDLGLKLAEDKCQPPATSIDWLGYHINTDRMTVTVPAKKLAEVLQECEKWTSRSRANKKSLQSLIGKLMHVAYCIPHARKFTIRLLATLRALQDRLWTTLTPDVKLDIKWFLNYASPGNGISLLTSNHTDFEIECDACLLGAGGASHDQFYKWEFTPRHKKLYTTIHALEAINILVALCTLAPAPQGYQSHVIIHTDNIASSFALMTGKTKDSVLGACARQIWLEAARRHLDFTIKHKPGSQIPLADALSRYFTDSDKKALADRLTTDRGLTEKPPVLNGYNFFDHDL